MRKLILLAVVMVFFGADVVVAQQKGEVKSYDVEMGSLNNKNLGGYLDSRAGLAYGRLEASYSADNIDLLFYHGKTSGANLLVPASNSGLAVFSKFLLERIGAWSQRNNGILISLGANGSKTFDGIKSADDVKNAFERAYRSINKIKGYDPMKHGPGDRLTQVNEGDVFLFKSYERNTYFIGKVNTINRDAQATIAISIKVVDFE
ncbi:hypothetical protein G5B30_00715 [Sphingobacterium sp. SGG-5]|uniref:hypothetical protein n=1 Tax=Sphingobacterium sp. SGG-5 TaxID=2710881 RepID=UPI0013EE3AD1|nr:hypothetical protein [Sphingobacterium sp. SGG-5]NGM60425.1 hypothetical protein [Sphingobacterium sp. SGG-5]